MPAFLEYTDPRLVALYDVLPTHRRDADFYLQLAADLQASTVIDIGCGTGALACEMAGRGHRVIGVDPAPAMLDVARDRPSGGSVRWLDGDASVLTDQQADLAILTGHVAQVIADDRAWADTLAAIYWALRPGGHVAFESRNPDASSWTAFGMGSGSRKHVSHPDLGDVQVWHEVTGPDGDLVSFDLHYRFAASREELISSGRLRFRTSDEFVRSMAEAGFSVAHTYGDFDRGPVRPESPELIFVAARRSMSGRYAARS